MEVPIQGRPKHHCYLAGGTCRCLEVVTRRVRYRGDEEVILLQRGLLVGMYILLFLPRWHPFQLNFSLCCLGMRIGVVNGLNDHSPTCREDTAVNIEFIGFEEEATKYWCHSQILAIGKMYNSWRGCHADRVVEVRKLVFWSVSRMMLSETRLKWRESAERDSNRCFSQCFSAALLLLQCFSPLN